MSGTPGPADVYARSVQPDTFRPIVEGRLGHRGADMSYSEFIQMLRRWRRSDLLHELATLACIIQPIGMPIQASPMYWHHCPPWAIATISRDVALHCNDHRHRDLTANDLLTIFNAWSKLYDPPESHDFDPLAVFSRYTYEQSAYQESLYEEIARTPALLLDGARTTTCRVITPQTLDALVGAPLKQVIGATFFLHVAALSSNGTFDIAWLDNSDLQPIYDTCPREVIERRLRDLTSTLPEFAASFQATNDLPTQKRRWAYNPLAAKPFLQLDDGNILAPQPSLIIRTIAPSSLYYAGVDQHGSAFADDLGTLTEDYVGRQLRTMPEAHVYPEISYGSSVRKSIDWFLVLEDLVVLVEVKGLRASMGHRTGDLNATKNLTARLDKAIDQVNRTQAQIHARNPGFNHIPTDRPHIGLIITAEPIHLANTPILREKMSQCDLPLLIGSLRDLEQLTCLTGPEASSQLASLTTDQDRSTWTLAQALDIPPGRKNQLLQSAMENLPILGHGTIPCRV